MLSQKSDDCYDCDFFFLRYDEMSEKFTVEYIAGGNY